MLGGVLGGVCCFFCLNSIINFQKLEEEFKASREEQEQFYSLERPIPKQLRLSLSLPGGDREDRDMRARSTTSLDPPPHSAGASKSRPPLKPLDEVVMGTPILNHVRSPDSDKLQNGSSS